MVGRILLAMGVPGRHRRPEVRSIVELFFHRLMELSPVDATRHGLHEHDARLPDGGLAAVRERDRLLASLASEVRQAVPDPDADLAVQYAELALFRDRVLRPWARAAEAPDSIGAGILLLLSRSTTPLEDRLHAIASRLEVVPGYLRASRECLTEPVSSWNRVVARRSAARHPRHRSSTLYPD